MANEQNDKTVQKKQPFFYWRSFRAVQEIQEKLIKCKSLIVYDIETTGTNPLYHRMIELAAVWLVKDANGKFMVRGRLHKYFKLPENIPLPDEIVNLTGITREDLEKQPFEEECMEDIMFFFENTPIAGYNNLGFDDLFLKQFFYRNGITYQPKDSFDVLMMAHDFTASGQLENFKLCTVAQAFGISAEKYHAAFSDAEVTATLLNSFMECYQNGETATFCGKERPEVAGIAYWGREGQENETDRPIKRIYVRFKDNASIVFYDVISGVWYTQSKQIDMDWLEKNCWELVGADNEQDFRGFQGSIKATVAAAA